MTTFFSDWGRTYRYTVPFIYSIQYGTYKVYNMHFIAGQPILAQTDTHPNIYTHAHTLCKSRHKFCKQNSQIILGAFHFSKDAKIHS